jgi:hypothetical protein
VVALSATTVIQRPGDRLIVQLLLLLQLSPNDGNGNENSRKRLSQSLSSSGYSNLYSLDIFPFSAKWVLPILKSEPF